MAFAGAAAALSVSWVSGSFLVCDVTWGASAVCIVVYVARGWQVSGTGLRGLEALLHAPVFLVWRVGVAWTRPFRRPDVWVRTTRERAP
jgi:hypothetical protein